MTELPFYSGNLVIDFDRHSVSVAGRIINLTITEYKILSRLAHNAGQLVTSNQILGEVWGENCISETHLLQVSMARLRKKLGDDAKSPRYILTRPGIGYMIAGFLLVETEFECSGCGGREIGFGRSDRLTLELTQYTAVREGKVEKYSFHNYNCLSKWLGSWR